MNTVKKVMHCYSTSAKQHVSSFKERESVIEASRDVVLLLNMVL